MDNKTLLALFDCNDYLKQWFRSAADEEWNNLSEVAEAAVHEYGEIAGLLECNHCNRCILDGCIADVAPDDLAVMLEGDVNLCVECYDAAVVARKKIVVYRDETGDYEDMNALSDEEIWLVQHLERQEKALNYRDRDLIRLQPHDQRKFCHRIVGEVDRFIDGKTVVDCRPERLDT